MVDPFVMPPEDVEITARVTVCDKGSRVLLCGGGCGARIVVGPHAVLAFCGSCLAATKDRKS